jgi:outer membrane protein assembly factor BamB
MNVISCPRAAIKLLIAGIVFTFVVTGAPAPQTHADDWPNWRGSNHDDISTETGLLKKWPEQGPRKLWHVDHAGLGYAGFSVVGDRLFTLGQEDDVQFAICLNVADGEIIWKVDLGTGFVNDWGDGPRATPSIDGDLGYFMTANGDLACLNVADGSEVWSVNLKEYGGGIPFWGYSESPLVDQEKIICTPGGGEGTLLALDKKTGKKIWQSEPITKPMDDGKRSEPAKAHYSSVLPIEQDGQRQYVQLTELAVVGISADDGAVLWQSDWPGRVAVIPSPIFDDGMVYVTSGYGIGSKLIELNGTAEPEVKWRNKIMKNHHGGVIQIGDYFYGYSDKVGLTCQSQETGRKVWATKKIKKGAISYAGDRFYYIQEDDGQVFLLAANEKKPKVEGRFIIEPQSERRKSAGKIWVHPVIANGRLFLRDQEVICCYDVAK